MPPRRVLKSLSLAEKFQIIKEVELGARKKDVAVKYEIPASTLSTILKNKSSIIHVIENMHGDKCEKGKRIKKPTYIKVDTAVLEWFKATRARNQPVSGTVIKQKALELSSSLGETNFKASTGWLDKWKQRYGICRKKPIGENAVINDEDWKLNFLPDLLENYEERNVFNVGETGLFFRCLPDQTLTYSGQPCEDGKHSSERVTCLFTANMDGTEKLKILVIGKKQPPLYFRGIKWLPVDYKANNKAWMTAEIFENWLLELDKKFTEKDRKILMFIGKSPAHPENLQSKLESIELKFFPPNMTSELQPLRHGIISNVKYHYRRRILSKSLNELEVTGNIPKVSLMDCIQGISKAWEMDVKPETIYNCFKMAGFGQYSTSEEKDDYITLAFLNEHRNNSVNDDAIKDLRKQYVTWMRLNHNTKIEDFKFNAFVDVDNEVITSDSTTGDMLEEILSSDDDNDGEAGFVRPTQKETTNAIEILRKFFYTEKNTSEDLHKSLNAIEIFLEESIKNEKKD